nr:GNAT family N-acetyltransferase [Halorientalis sp.]
MRELRSLSVYAEEDVTGLAEAHRGHGIGSRLLDHGLNWTEEMGLTTLYSSFPATNEGAIDFFEAHAGAVEAVHESHYRIDGESVDEVMMSVSL